MAAQVCRTFLSALRNDPEIAAGGDKREAQVEIAGGVLGVGCQHSSSFPGSADTGAGAGDQGLDFRMACVCEMPDVGSQVAGSDENSIHAFDGGDGSIWPTAACVSTCTRTQIFSWAWRW